jgi:FAD-dependent oxidoreductase domain-containing protein 1
MKSLLQKKQSFDFLIMGGGAVGSSIALHLAQNGMRNIAVVERDFSLTRASTVLSAGGIRQQFSEPENIKMSSYGAQFLKNINILKVKEEDDDIDVQFRENGYLMLANSNNEHVLKSNNKIQHECGVETIKLFEKSELEQNFPWLNTESISMGSYGFKNEGYFDPWLYVSALKNKAVSMGVKYIQGEVVNANITEVVPGCNTFQISEVTVKDTKENLKADLKITAPIFINAAGAWASNLLDVIAENSVRPKAIKKIPIERRKRSIFTFHCPNKNPSYQIPLPNSPLVIDTSGVYFRPEGKLGQYIVGISPSEETDVNSESDEDLNRQAGANELFDELIWPRLSERVRAFEELKVVSSWSGFYDYNTLDQVFIV